MLFPEPVSFQEADDFLHSRQNTATHLKSREIAMMWDAEARQAAFFSARVTQAAIVSRLHDVCQSVLSGQMSRAQARRLLREYFLGEGADALAAMGFAPARRAMGISQLASLPRLELIIYQNVKMAQERGHYQQWQKVKQDFPYGIWRVGNCANHREAHLARDGKIYAFDHPIWTQSPPGGEFNCHCYRELLSEKDMKERGLSPEPLDSEFEPSSLGFDPSRPLATEPVFGRTTRQEYANISRKQCEEEKPRVQAELEQRQQEQARLEEQARQEEAAEAARKAAEEAARKEAERIATEEAARQAEAARLEAERLSAEEAARQERERFAAEEAARLEAEKKSTEENARKAAEEAARLEKERVAKEEAKKLGFATQRSDKRKEETVNAPEPSALEKSATADKEETARQEKERLAAEEAAHKAHRQAQWQKAYEKRRDDWKAQCEQAIPVAPTDPRYQDYQRCVNTVVAQYTPQAAKIGKPPKLAFFPDDGKSTRYNPTTDTIELHASNVQSKHDWNNADGAIRHEWGHWGHITYFKKHPEILQDITKAGRKDWTNIKTIYNRNMSQLDDFNIQNHISMKLYNKTYINLSLEERHVVMGFTDTIEDLSNCKYGIGHGSAYYKKLKKAIAAGYGQYEHCEAIANVRNMAMVLGESQVSAYFPNTVDILKTIGIL